MKFIFMGLYALVLVVISIFTTKKSKTGEEFFLGGRKTGGWFSAFAYGTTYFSAVIFIGYAGKFGWNFGVSSALIGIGNAVVGSYLAWKVLAKRTHSMTKQLDASTMPQFFEKRYNSKVMKVFSASVIFIFLVPYSASVYQGISYLFESIFQIPFGYCVIGIAVLTAIYLVAGGYLASVLVDFFQGIIMIIGVVLMIVCVLRSQQVGGLTAGLSRLAEIDSNLIGMPSGKGLLTLGSVVVLTSLGSWGLPQMIHKFYTIKDEASIKRATTVSTAFALIIGIGAYMSGSFSRLFLNNTMPVDANGLANTDMIMPEVLQIALPDILLSVIVLLVLSASMSTLSSLVLVSSSAVAMDLVKGSIAPDISDKSMVRLMRALCIVFIAVSVVIALNKFSAIVTLMSFSWGTISGSFIGAYVFGLYDKKANRSGAWCSMLVGFTINIVGAIVSGFDGGLAPLLGCISMIASLVTMPLASRLIPLLSSKQVVIGE